MEFGTPRLRIDRLLPGDAQALYAYRGDPVVARFQGWRPADADATLAFIGRQPGEPSIGWFQRAIRLREEGALIGDLGVCLPAEPGESVEFGITIAPAHQGKGYAREALQEMFGHGFGQLGWRRVHASVDPRNVACLTLLRALGMRQEAHFRESLWLHGEWVDDAVFAMLAREWQAAQPL
ncbi:MAG: GNAT family N-acetyltransferase [Frateuria sp.]|nr:GNAT family N-acetyltransferase [Frateuria sp.]